MDNDANKNTEGKIRPTDNSGKTVQGIDQVLKYDYNEKGKRTSLERDNNVDGKFDYREEYTLNANGNIEEKRIDLTNDGKVDKVTINTLNPKGEVTTAEYYTQTADGKLTYTGKDEFVLDVNGYTEKKTSYSAINQVLSIETYEIDEQGREVKRIDNGGDGVDRIETYTKDANGNITKTEIDTDNDGIPNSYIEKKYNPLGNETEIITYNDDVATRVVKKFYDNYGNVIREEVANGINQPTSSIMETQYGSDNNPVWRYFDRKGDGISTDDTSYLDYYNEYGNRVKEYSFSGKVSYEDALKALAGAQGSPKIAGKLDILYDDKGYQTAIFSDINNDNNTINLKNQTMGLPVRDNDSLIKFTGYSDVWGGKWTKRSVTNYYGTRTETQSYDDTGTVANVTIDNRNDNIIDVYTYGDPNARYGTDRVDNWTNWAESKLNELKGLSEIRLSATASTDITLDSETIGKLSPTGKVGSVSNTLTIKGDTTDKVNLTDSFTKLDSTSKIGSDTFNMYSTKVDETTYTLYIDNDIQTVIG
ncbi:hypothetical protein ACERCG_11805 [Mannheimia sp. E30BD]|uniref:hypothetical protein n=1 Tax=Mannheimia sp. E30BD TaxID=3278708 RepID=UPI00359D1A6A